MNNIERFKQDLENLIKQGENLYKTMQAVFLTDIRDNGKLDNIKIDYEMWYSESLEIIKQILPNRLNDFLKLYKKHDNNNDINIMNYTIEYALVNYMFILRNNTVIAHPKFALPRVLQQIGIVKSCERKLEGSLLNVRKLLSADLFKNELDAAEELKKNGFLRAAGAVAGVVLERHLTQVCDNRKIKITKKKPSIFDLNQFLHESSVYDAVEFEKVNYLKEIRNKCDHPKDEPTVENIDDLIKGVTRIIKMIG